MAAAAPDPPHWFCCVFMRFGLNCPPETNVHNESNKTTEPDMNLYLLIKIAGPYHGSTLANLHFTGVRACVRVDE